MRFCSKLLPHQAATYIEIINHPTACKWGVILVCFIGKLLANKYHQILSEKKWNRATELIGKATLMLSKEEKNDSQLFVLYTILPNFMNATFPGAGPLFVLGTTKKSYDRIFQTICHCIITPPQFSYRQVNRRNCHGKEKRKWLR